MSIVETLFDYISDSRIQHAERILKKHNIDPNYKDEDGDSLLFMAADTSLKLVKILLEKGADANIQNAEGKTPMLNTDDFDVIKCLVDHGANVNCQDDTGRTPILNAKNIEEVKFLLENGANINHQDNNGYTLLHVAMKNLHLAIIEVLLEAQARMDLKNKMGKYAIDYLAHYPVLLEIVESIVKNGLSHTREKMNLSYGIYDLHETLYKYKDKFIATFLPYIEIIPYPTKPKLWHSKCLGYPYLPKGEEYPLSENGIPLALLVQVNFEEMPTLEYFPNKGILQFFIVDCELDDEQGSIAGMNFGEGSFESLTKQRNFRVRYYEQVLEDEKQLVDDFSFLPSFGYLPIYNEKQEEGIEHGLNFRVSREWVSSCDYQFEKFFGQEFMDNITNKEKDCFYASSEYEDGDNSGFKIGGYASTTQGDPRANVPEEEWLLLLQIDEVSEDNGLSIMWGDGGAAQLFIKKKDLMDRNFSEVAFYWDCA